MIIRPYFIKIPLVPPFKREMFFPHVTEFVGEGYFSLNF